MEFPLGDIFFTLLITVRLGCGMIDSFLKYLQFEKRVSHHTVLAYQNDLVQFQNFLHKNFPEESAQHADYGMVRMWIVSLVEEAHEPQTVNRKIAALRSFFKYLLREEVISKDPMMKIRVMKTKKKLPVFVKENEIDSVIDKPADEDESPFEHARNKLAIELLYSTGIRLSELINLEVNRIDLRNNVIKVLGKRNKERVIPFPATLKPQVQDYLKLRNKTVDLKAEKYLLVTEKGEKCYPMLIQRMIRRYLLASSVDKKSPHVLRHTYATHLLDKGAEINAVKDLLGHSSLAATQVYTHNSMEKLKKVFQQAHPKA
jgi:integrase/recombinase XerC